MKKIIITIDGPAASGKGRISKYISRKWKLTHLDSGILYRKIAYFFINNKININNENQIRKTLNNNILLTFRKNNKLRTEEISRISSKIAVYKIIRDYVNAFQRNFVKKNSNKRGFVIDGRDIGSVVFKNADLKLYIEVNEENRAKRRYKQLIDTGEKSIYPQILREIKLRDKKDKNRKMSPLVIPRGAYKINNNNDFKKTLKQINDLMENLYNE